MAGLEDTRKHILRDLDAFIERLEAAPEADWDRPVRCEGWVVRDLANHVAMGPRVMSACIDAMRRGETTPPALPEFPPLSGRDEILASLREARQVAGSTLDSLTESDLTGMCPFPFATVPGFIALPIMYFEQGVHLNDLEWALGNEVPMSPELVETTTMVASGMLPNLGQAPDKPVAFKLSGSSVALTLAHRDGAWQMAEDASLPTAVVEGRDDSAILLFAIGRIGADHPSLTVKAEPELAAKFKTYFPGP